MAKDISRLAPDDLLRLINVAKNSTDNALDNGTDVYNILTAWRAQFASSEDAATDLNTKGAVSWVTASHVDNWMAAASGFNHLVQVAHGLDAGSYVATDVYYFWNKIAN